MELLCSKEVKELFGVNDSTLKYWRDRNLIPYWKRGKLNVYDKDALLEIKDSLRNVCMAQENIDKELEALEKEKVDIAKERNRLSACSELGKIYTYGWHSFIMKCIDAKRREFVVFLDYLDGKPLTDISLEWNISKQRVCQLVTKAIRLLKISWPDKDEQQYRREMMNRLENENTMLRKQVEELKKNLPVQNSQKKPLPELFLSNITDYPLSIRALNCLKCAGIKTIGELCVCSKTYLLGRRNFGKKTLTELEEFLNDKGLSFGMDLSMYEI